MSENLNPLEYDPENQQIAERIKELFVRVKGRKVDGGRYVVWDRVGSRSSIDLGSRFSIDMDVLDSEDARFYRGGVDVKSKLPSDLEYPLYILDFDTFQHLYTQFKQAANTPYGRLPRLVIGPDQNLYGFSTYYFFDFRGIGLKYEDVYSWGDPSSVFPRGSTLRADDLTQVEFIPNKEASRFMPLEAGDYEMIAGYLEMIESGEFEAI